jgi:hypothetical protein
LLAGIDPYGEKILCFKAMPNGFVRRMKAETNLQCHSRLSPAKSIMYLIATRRDSKAD